jgi:hypothetical protein
MALDGFPTNRVRRLSFCPAFGKIVRWVLEVPSREHLTENTVSGGASKERAFNIRREALQDARTCRMPHFFV